ncbi:hypothetical protein HPB47_028051 [Ixodes persulcatus]|uniref:Uncharacterized protein n=1 Tax=Ixodes persulcatus TaxID=34615 RepID=A0AC60PVZ0_IXOPE|nr:hypothetical protein HPB47_028051 [Ixodes persulcatus]
MAEATLTGFSSFLDWKRLTFQWPLPRAWICDLCGLVSQTSMVTGCLHAFCLDCYKHIQAEAGPKCPLDDAVIDPAETKQFVLGDAQRKDLTVCCLNAQHGCDFQGPLSDLENHFVKNCSFHMVSCKACHGPVLRNKALEHSKACHFQGRNRAKCGTRNGAPEQDVKAGGNHALEVDALTADAVRCAGDDKVNILVEHMRKCSLSVNDLVDLARNLAESVQHCVRATDESTTKTSNLVGTVEKCTEAVNNVRAVCEYIPNNWLATCFRPSHLGTNQHVFACRNFSAKLAGAPAGPNDAWNFYPVRCSQGNIMVKGYRVELSQAIYLDQSKGKCIAFKLTFVAEAQTVMLPIDMTLVLVHPTQPSLNKNRPLKSGELYVTSHYVKDFSFTADTLREQGFVADDMLLLCLEVIE